jgi:hypothetical protein
MSGPIMKAEPPDHALLLQADQEPVNRCFVAPILQGVGQAVEGHRSRSLDQDTKDFLKRLGPAQADRATRFQGLLEQF